VRATHAGFLVDGQQRFERPMRQRVIREGGQDQGHANAVVGSQRRLLGQQPAIAAQRLNRIAGEIVRAAGILLADHIQVRLQNDARRLFHAAAGRFAEQEVAGRIDRRRQPPGQRPVLNLVAQAPFRFRLARNTAQRGKMRPDGGRLEGGENGVDTSKEAVVHGG
jgi:hypothetical protein